MGSVEAADDDRSAAPGAGERAVADTPSQFWKELAEEHAGDLASFGFLAFKRHQALRYFTWQWRWSTIRRSEQFRFLLSHTGPADWLRCGVTPMSLSDVDWEGVPWPKRDRWLYVFAVRLLWVYATAHDSADVLRLPEPTLGSPFPVRWQGRLISQDLANSALEAASIARALAGRTPTSILEVGAGYGRTAYVLMSLFPDADYTVVDIEPAISISRRYLTELFPDRSIRFLSPEMAAALPEGSVDLAVSISSLQEMTKEQVGWYLQLLDRVASGGTVYLKQWVSWRNPVDQETLVFDEYPVPARWSLQGKGLAPVQTKFVEASWSIPK